MLQNREILSQYFLACCHCQIAVYRFTKTRHLNKEAEYKREGTSPNLRDFLLAIAKTLNLSSL